MDSPALDLRLLPTSCIPYATIRNEAVSGTFRKAISMLGLRGRLPRLDGTEGERAEGRGKTGAGEVDV